MSSPHIEFPVLGAKWAIGTTALAHVAVGALAIGFAFIVTVMQIVGYLKKDRRYDLMAKRVQLIHVCIYNIGTILAIGLIFCLSGLFPQFWSQIFHHLFWPMIVEEFLFFLLATTLTFHYFFWEYMWGHKRLHIFLGALLTPLFLLQFYIINGMGAFMLTPGFQEAETSLSKGILGWDTAAFYNPSFLMLTVHRALANIAYGGFVVAAICGVLLYVIKSEKRQGYYEDTARLAFYTAFIMLLSLPIIGYFYAYVLRYHANAAYVNLMWGRGDVVALGINWWWMKHLSVATMMGMCLAYFQSLNKRGTHSFAMPSVMIWGIALFYTMFYFAMGMIMTWKFFFWMLAFGVGGAALAAHLMSYHGGSPRAVFLIVGILSFITVMLGGYSREASRPRFVNRISHYDKVYIPKERAPYLMVDVRPEDIPPMPTRPKPPPEAEPGQGPVWLIRERCSACHTLQRVKNYKLKNWRLIVRQMRAYGLKLTGTEARTVTEHLETGKPY